MIYDRNEPMSYEDWLCAGKSAADRIAIQDALAARQAQRDAEVEAEEQAERAMREDRFTP